MDNGSNTAYKKKLNSILKPCLPRVILLSGMTLVQSVLQVAMALLTRNIIDAALSGSGHLGLWAVLFITDLVMQVLVHAFLSWYAGSTTDQYTARLRAKLLRSAVYSADSRLEQFHSGQLVSRGMEDVHTVCDGFINALPSLVGQVTRLVAAFGAILLIYPSAAGVLAVVAVVVVFGVAMLRPALKKRHRAVREADEKVLAAMQEDMQQLELIQSLDAREQILRRFQRLLRGSLCEKTKRRVWVVGSNSLLSIASMLGTALLLLWGATKVAAGVLSYGSLTSMLQLLSLFRGPVLGLSGLWTRFSAIEVAAERLSVILQAPEEKPQLQQITAKAVVFDNVTFGYAGEDTNVVENFSIRFPLDRWSCLTGISGRGKTTLFKLILGLHKPQAGRVYLETECGDIPCSEATRHLFAYVPQDYALFSGTVLENLLLVAPDASEEQRRKALEVAQAEFVLDMSSGENTALRENNTGLSKGQLQRLAIARAILMERPFFLLDECTSALDAETESAVLKGLYALGKQAILVTHRPEALETLEAVTPVSMEE